MKSVDFNHYKSVDFLSNFIMSSHSAQT